jgi:hypothetical protein
MEEKGLEKKKERRKFNEKKGMVTGGYLLKTET